MLDRVVNYIVEKQIMTGLLKQEDKTLYMYGYYLAIETLLNILVGILIGIILHCLNIVITFWLLYIPLRSFCGGWHAKNSFQCLIFSNAVLLIVIKLKMIITFESNIVLILLLIIEAVIIIVNSPTETENKRISSKEKLKYKAKSSVIIFLQFLFCLFFNYIKVMMIIVYSILLISMFVQKIKK